MKNPVDILLVENVHPIALEKLQAEGYNIKSLPHAPSEAELLEILPNYNILGIRSKTELTKRVIEKNPQLFLVGAFCIGTNQIDLQSARSFGIPVFNAPHSNTRSVAELVIAEMIALSRQLGDRNTQAHAGGWVKSAAGSREVRGKTLGIIGYGHIGSQLSIMAEAMGLRVVYYDVIKKLPLGNAMARRTMNEVLKEADFVSLHVPETPETRNLITKRELNLMKKGSYLINASRGTVVVIEDLVELLKSRHIAGCAIDVFPMEPSSNKEKFHSPLQGLDNVILTPHIGGSTEEAQYNIGVEVAESFLRYLKIGSSSGAVNFPNVDLPLGKGACCRLLNVHRNEPGVLGEINGIVSEHGANIQAQFLSTDEKIGYLVMDLETDKIKDIYSEVVGLKRSLRTRLLG
ncbi:MAG: phosphoglycerate dehydrogenase [Bdellovibrionota bacterium]